MMSVSGLIFSKAVCQSTRNTTGGLQSLELRDIERRYFESIFARRQNLE